MNKPFQIAIVGTRFGAPDIEKETLKAFPVEFVMGAGKTAAEIVETARDAAFVMAGGAPKFTADVIRKLTNLRAIVRYGVGVDTVELEAASAQNIIVANVPDYATEEVSTHTVSLILACTRKLFQAHRSVVSGQWHIANIRPLYSAADQTVGIVGFGRIGQAVARKLRPFNFELLVLDPYATPEALTEYGATAVELPELLSRSDIITLNAPLVEDTHYLINADTLGQLKPTAFLINTSRGGLIDETALVDALKNGSLAGAALDVSETEPMPADHPLLQLENVIVTPHMAWYTEQATRRMRLFAAQEVVRILQGESPLNLVKAGGNNG